jgi:hypothetical protein
MKSSTMTWFMPQHSALAVFSSTISRRKLNKFQIVNARILVTASFSSSVVDHEC